MFSDLFRKILALMRKYRRIGGAREAADNKASSLGMLEK
jgi:hypothetical protein